MVGLPCALRQVLDLDIFYADLVSKKFILALDSRDIARHVRLIGSDLSRLIVACRGWLLNRGSSFLIVATFRDKSRQVATRLGGHLVDIGDVLRDGVRGDQIFFTEGSFDKTAFEMAFGAIALHAARGTWMTSLSIVLECFVD